ncbi:MAG: MgtC/SapB family protein [Labilithrix sp.]|nr:MgtC/SapB family protein [Labilithrix sp.]
MLVRIGTGAALGAVIGYERDRHGRPVGLRTHLIVAMAAATFMVVSAQFAYLQGYTHDGPVDVDGSRIAASVVSGIGFLAGGAILRTGFTVQGLTTAAGLWLVTAIGMCAGGGMFVEAIAVTGMGVVALTVLRRFEDKDDHVLKRQLELVLGDPDALDEVVGNLGALGVTISDVAYERRLDEDKRRVGATLDLAFKDTLALPKLLHAVEAVAGVRRLHLKTR